MQVHRGRLHASASREGACKCIEGGCMQVHRGRLHASASGEVACKCIGGGCMQVHRGRVHASASGEVACKRIEGGCMQPWCYVHLKFHFWRALFFHLKSRFSKSSFRASFVVWLYKFYMAICIFGYVSHIRPPYVAYSNPRCASFI